MEIEYFCTETKENKKKGDERLSNYYFFLTLSQAFLNYSKLSFFPTP